MGSTLTLATDEPFWIARTIFYEYFDQDDFLKRECVNVSQNYLEAWFVNESNGARKFMLPTVQYIGGKTQFINGRHRAAVLIKCMARVPIAFAMSSSESKDWLAFLPKVSMGPAEAIEIPDLPVVKCFHLNGINNKRSFS